MHSSCVVRRASWLLGAIVLCASAPVRLCAQERAIPLTADGYVRIINRAGEVRVLGWDKDSVRMTGELASGQRLFGGGSERMVKVGVDGADTPARLTVQVPRGAKVVIDAGESAVEADGLRGPVEIRGGAGAIRMSGASVRVTIETVDGAVTLVGGPYRSTEVRTAGGIIRASGLQEEFLLSSVTGAITGEVTGVTRGRIESVTGVVRFSGDVDPTGTLAIESHGGDVEVAIDPRKGVELVATAFGGAIENALTQSVPRPVPNGRGIQLGTTVGGGGGTVTITGFKGTIRLKPR